MRVALASDHAGYRYKQRLIAALTESGHQVTDFGTGSEEPVDYPDFVLPAARAVANGRYDRGIVLGGSGNGEAMAANRIRGIRCAVCWDVTTARLARAHNDANMLALGQRLVTEADLPAIVETWLTTPFEGGRHVPRIEKLDRDEALRSPGGASILFLDESAVAGVLRYADLIPAIARALTDLSTGRAVQPVRSVVPIAPYHGFLGSMPAYAGALGAKLVTFYPRNEGIHTHHALIALFRVETGEPLAVMDGRLITEMRTAAASAAATDLLARPEASVLALLGSGVQARSHLAGLRTVRRFREVRVWSPRNAARFAEEHGVHAASTPAAAVRGADVVVVATASQTPVLHGAWLGPGTHVNAVGATRPDWRELDDEVVGRARVYVDSRAAALVESGDVMAAPGPVTELGEALAGKAPGRQAPDEVTLFKSVGVAVEDVAAAALVYEAASPHRPRA